MMQVLLYPPLSFDSIDQKHSNGNNNDSDNNSRAKLKQVKLDLFNRKSLEVECFAFHVINLLREKSGQNRRVAIKRA